MTQQELIRRLTEYAPKTRVFLKIQHLYLFGSYSRNEQQEDSDIDLVIDFKEGIGSLLDLVAFQNDLEDIFHKKVEVFTQKSLSKYIREDVMNNAIKVY